MGEYTVLIEASPFCAFDKAPLRQLEDAGIRTIDLRGAGVEDPQFMAALASADAIICGNDLRVDDALLAAAPRVG